MKTQTIASAFVAVSLLFSACVVAPQPATSRPISTHFDPSAYAPYRQSGTAKISGQAFLKTRGGDVKVGAGNWVTLSPATAYAKEVRAIRDAGLEPENYNEAVVSQFRDTIRKSMADAQGNFVFTDLPAGEYLLETNITWEVPGRYGLLKTGGLVHQFVTLKDGEDARVMLTE